MNNNEEVDIVEEIVTLYVVLYILGYIQVYIKLAEDLSPLGLSVECVGSEIQTEYFARTSWWTEYFARMLFDQYTSPTEIRVYTWPELD